MTPKPLAIFTADFADDEVQDAHGVVLYGGRNVAEAIRELVIRCGQRASELTYEDVKGWQFDAYCKSQRYSCQLTSFYPNYLLDLDDPSRRRSLSPTVFSEFWEALDAALRKDPRIHDLKWHTRADPPDPWEGFPEVNRDDPAAAEVARRIVDQARQAKRERRAASWGCFFAVLLLAVGTFGAFSTIAGVAKFLGGGAGTTTAILVGLSSLSLAAVGLGLTIFLVKRSETPSQSPPN